jgi:hypothetical protein
VSGDGRVFGVNIDGSGSMDADDLATIIGSFRAERR